MRIVTWNLNHGRASAVWPRLQASLGADIVLLQEAQSPDWRGGVGWVWDIVPNGKWGSAVLAAQGALSPIPVPGYEGWVVGGQVTDIRMGSGARPLFAFSIHAPSRTAGQPRGSYVKEVVKILDQIRKTVPPDADLILGGDFNFRSLGHRREGEAFETTSVERKALMKFEDMGLVSCWTAAHPGRALVQTLRWSKDKTPGRAMPFHADGIFVPASWRPGISCEVLTSACYEVSDHDPVAAWITL
jgi:endonuclease/exonuclease/phosphatase family metal-dependent hydrolase